MFRFNPLDGLLPSAKCEIPMLHPFETAYLMQGEQEDAHAKREPGRAKAPCAYLLQTLTLAAMLSMLALQARPSNASSSYWV